jgi:hypothetical protein
MFIYVCVGRKLDSFMISCIFQHVECLSAVVFVVMFHKEQRMLNKISYFLECSHTENEFEQM